MRTRHHPVQVTLLSVGAAVGIAALGQMGRETAQERRGTHSPTYAATALDDLAPAGYLATWMQQEMPAAPPSGWRALMLRIWAAPTTAFGLTVAALSFGRWSWRREHGTLVVSGARSPLLRLAGFQANAIGHVVLAIPRDVPDRLLVHEVAHVRQAERLGPLTLPLYIWWMARHGYRNHPMERGARATTRRWQSEGNG